MHYQKQVKEFMTTFGQNCPSKSEIPDENTRILRVKLLLEEVLELAESSGIDICVKNVDHLSTNFVKSGDIQIIANQKPVSIVGIADAIADISYVNYGAANAYGIDIEPIEQEVHSSNMTKLFSSSEILDLDVEKFTIQQVGDKFLVKSLDGKIQKSPSYQKANIEQFFTNES